MKRFLLLFGLLLGCANLTAADTVVISEFMAANSRTQVDEDGDHEDWIEVMNVGSLPVNLLNWALTDEAVNLGKWRFPSVIIGPNATIVVFASSKNRATPGRPLHTNFKLNNAGEYLALIRWDGSIATEFSPAFPRQASDVSYGFAMTQAPVSLVSNGSPARVLAPANNALGSNWIQNGFIDSAWRAATNGIGFQKITAPVTPSGLLADSMADFSGMQGSNHWYYGYWDRGNDTNGVYAPSEFIPFPRQAGSNTVTASNAWDGFKWDLALNTAPWTELGNNFGHPNLSPQWHYTIRRWVSTADGPVRIVGYLFAGPGCGGDGVDIKIWVDGTLVHTGTAFNSTDEYGVNVVVSPGSRVDFGVGPNTANDWCDAFNFSARILQGALADSVEDWSTTGQQRSRGWSYGYYNKTADSDGTYQTANFTPFTTAQWVNGKWDLAVDVPPSTEVTSTGMHPSSSPSVQWAIRRWTSSYSGKALLSCRLGNAGGCGGGTMARIFKDGQQIYSRGIFANAAGFWVPVDVSVGTILDFAIDPNGDDACDLTTFMVRIQEGNANLLQLADSESEWVAGVQGANNWRYGYYNKGADANGVYSSTTDFRDSSNDPNWIYDSQWHRNPGFPPWTHIGSTWWHPNGASSGGGENWAIRRWASKVSGPISIAWNHRKQNGGGGTTVNVLKNGQWIGSTVVGGDFTGVNNIVSAVVATNDFIDFVLTPVGPDGSAEDGSDASEFATVIFANGADPAAVNALVADSIADWSPSGEQGYKGWSYGIYNLTGDPDGIYQATNFVSVSGGWAFTGSEWTLGNNGNISADPPWNNIGQATGHPNSTNNSAEIWSIRRWTSSFSGPATITWRLAMVAACMGNGTSVRVFRNGTQVDFAAIAGNDTAGITRSITIPALAAGDVIDVALTPVGANNAGDDGCDASLFSASIYRSDSLARHISSDISGIMYGSNATVYARFPFSVSDPAALDFLKLRVLYNDGFVAYLNGVEVARRNAPNYQSGGFFANSITEFSSVQGSNHWFSGYYDKTTDLNGVYETSDFSVASPWHWSGWGYNMSASPPWTQLDDAYSHPNGSNSGHEQWPMRRWVCETSGSLRINLSGKKQNGGCGNGVTFRIFHNGAQIFHRTVEFSDTTGFTTNITVASAQVGDLIDIALDSTGVDGLAQDGCDGSIFSATIEQEAIPALAWNSQSLTPRSAEASLVPEEIDLSAFRYLLAFGNNVLAIQGLNASANDANFLLLPELTGTMVTVQTNSLVYFTSPTPGKINGLGTTNLGPMLSDMASSPIQPLGTNDLHITVRANATLNPVQSLVLRYRVMYGPEYQLTLFDDGAHGDGATGDGVWSATIPAASAASAGQMIRWYFVATDSLGNATRDPSYLDPLNSPEYYGTMVFDPSVATQLPVLYWFVQNPGAANDYYGTRCSIYYEGQFIDNVSARLHGQSTAGFPKKSYNFDLNSGNHLKYAPNTPDLEEFVLLTTYADKTHMRNLLAFDTYADAEVPANIAFAVRVQQNGQFHSLANFAENANSRFLERLGFDPNGAMYKMYNQLTSAITDVEKKTRRNEDNSDLQSLINNLNVSDETARKTYMFDNLDLAEIVNYMATRAPLNGDIDWGHKNFYLYHDTLGTGEWQALPQDVDLSYGHVWTCNTPCLAYFDDTIYTNMDFYGGYNVLFDQFKYTEPFRHMWLRRVRTLMDTLLQPPSTPLSNDVLHARMHRYETLMAPEAAMDLALWNPNWGDGAETLAQAVARMDATNPKNYLPGRRAYLFKTLSVDSGGPIPRAQSSGLALTISAVDYNPASTNQDQEYIQIRNPNGEAVDVSGWHMNGGVNHTFKPGTVIPGGATLYLAKNIVAFRGRAISPKRGEQRFVQGNYAGQLSARGETLALVDRTGQTNTTFTYTGSPSLPQQFLRVTELMYNPSALAGNTNDAQQFEYVELKNISPSVTLNLSGVRFTSGIEFDFTNSPITSLAPGARALVVKNAAAFAERYGIGMSIAGEFIGSLDNKGERIIFLDAANEEILDFTYHNAWYPITDGAGFSLVVVNEAAEPDAWNQKVQWRPSGVENGSPGKGDTVLPTVATLLVNEVLTHANLPALCAIEIYNPTANSVNIGGWFLSDNLSSPKKYRIPTSTVIPANSYMTFDESQYNAGGSGFSLNSTGDEVYLFSGDANTNLTGYIHGFGFGPAADGVTFGRYVNSQGEEHFVSQSSNTLGYLNAKPLVGPLVFNEIMYHPPTPGDSHTARSYIELRNISGAPLPLFDAAYPGNTWHMRGGVDFDFPSGVTIPASGLLLVVDFDPVNDLLALADFHSQYNIDPATPIFGPYSGKLANNSDTLKIERPDVPIAGVAPYILVEAVKYSDATPWPVTADGFGQSLQRLDPTDYSNDPNNWIAALPTPGHLGASVPALKFIVPPQLMGANFHMKLSGIPGHIYSFQTATNATGPWTPLTNIIADPTGLFELFDPIGQPRPPARFYRTKSP